MACAVPAFVAVGCSAILLNWTPTVMPSLVFNSTAPPDAAERQRLENTHPKDYQNPVPASTYNLVVIGGGTAGLVAAHGAAALGAKVALVERVMLGGDCLNVGCVPSKSIIRTSRLYANMREASQYGANAPDTLAIDFAATMQRMRNIRARVSNNDSVRRLTEAGVDVFLGQASFSGVNTIMVDDQLLQFKKALIAPEARPDPPNIPALAEAGYLTNETIFDLTGLPRRLLVIGGGPLGCVLAQAFCRFGSKTTMVQEWLLFLPKEERESSQFLSDSCANYGVDLRF